MVRRFSPDLEGAKYVGIMMFTGIHNDNETKFTCYIDYIPSASSYSVAIFEKGNQTPPRRWDTPEEAFMYVMGYLGSEATIEHMSISGDPVNRGEGVEDAADSRRGW